MKVLSEFLPELIALRKELHHNPEISGRENKTSRLILNFCSRFKPTLIIEKLGKTGLALIFDSGNPGKTLLFRSDMDALPIEEEIELPYTSSKKSLSHKCGHDGHMVILSGLAFLLHLHPVQHGMVILLFQPSEEVGKGAIAVLHDPKFHDFKPDFVFALHNLPGYAKNSILLKEGAFSMASEGLLIQLKGHASHAAYPEQGISPLPAVIELMDKLPKLAEYNLTRRDYTQLTITYTKIGRLGFGTVPGMAEIAMTLRAVELKELEQIHKEVCKTVAKIAAQYYLEEKFRRYEPFHPTINDTAVVKTLRGVAERHRFQIIELVRPFRWSEDFGQFTSRYKGAMFGLGAGENHSDLHTWYYDFPDEILETGILMFYGIIQDLLND
jgi:amidohydrolase